MTDFRLNAKALKPQTPPPPKAKAPEAAPKEPAAAERKLAESAQDVLQAAAGAAWPWDEADGEPTYESTVAAFTAADADRNGYLGSDELDDQRRFALMDTNADGKVALDEVIADQSAEAEAAAALAEHDADANGYLSSDEVADQAAFRALDTDADGRVTTTELRTPPAEPAAEEAAQPGDGQAPATQPTSAEPAATPEPAAETPMSSSPAATGDTAQLLGAMTAEDIEGVLVARGSVLAGQGYGAYILQMEQQYGVPAAQFLAQAVMESSLGNDGYTQPGFNIGNIRPGTSWDGPIVDGGSGQFRVYSSWEEGIEDYFKLLAGPIYAGKSLEEQLYTYCPPWDGNDTAHYHDQIQKLIYQWTGIQM